MIFQALLIDFNINKIGLAMAQSLRFKMNNFTYQDYKEFSDKIGNKATTVFWPAFSAEQYSFLSSN